MFLIVDGYVVLTERFTDLLRESDLGQSLLLEVSVYENDKATLCPRRYFLLNVAEFKHTVVTEKTERMEFKYGAWYARDPNKLVVLSTATKGVDIWADPKIRSKIFMSDRLVKEIKKGKFGRLFLYPMQVIDP